jgi:DNA polymerase (family 10)
MTNQEIARIFDRMAKVLAFKQADRFRTLAYERGAAALRDLKEDVADIARDERLEEIPSIGKDLSGMIAEYVKTGHIRKYEQERRGIPESLIDLMEIPGLGPKTLATLHRKLHVNDLEGLKRALDSQALLKLPGFGAKKAESLRRGIQLVAVGKVKDVRRAGIAGSLRRRRETIGDVDVLVASPKPEQALTAISKLPMVRRVQALGETKATLLLEGNVQVDVRAVAEESWGAALQYFTGSKEHNVHLRTLARDRGLKINEYGVFRGQKRIAGRTEEEVYQTLGLPVMPAEIRENRGEIEAAQKKRIPRIIDLKDLRGDLHAHSTYSDGHNTIAEMLERAEELGYEYLGMSDHSQTQRIAHGLDRKRLETKMEEVTRLRRSRRGKKPRLLLGAEVDILSDGSLDYPDDILRELDVVVVAVHGAFRQPADRMTKRLLDALDHPRVHVLAHPTGRLMGSREPIEFHFEQIVEKAVKNKVALEINGSYLRLDLNDAMTRAANDAGAWFAIGSDAHSTAQLEDIRYGVFQARRGWVQPASVVNTWPWSKLERWLAKR